LIAKRNQREREETFKNYVSESLLLLSENTAKLVGGRYLKAHYADFLRPQKMQEKKESSEEIISRMKKKVRGDK